MHPPTYPDSDQALSLAEQQSECELHTSIQVQRPWQEHPTSLAVRYHGTTALSIADLGQLRIPLDVPLLLQPVTVSKPWGEEVWFSGIEARGESHIAVGAGTLPLLDYLSLAPQRLCGRLPLILLKLLRSKPQPIAGELYFEIHEHKREVYVVLGVDRSLYPDDCGSVRFGMNQEKRRSFADDAAFRAAFLEAVGLCEAHGPEAISVESVSRRNMLSFIASRPLRVGDSLMVPSRVPHSLQPGLDVLEFQTPDFERKIIFASQPVLTQQGWDTAEAVTAMSVEPPPETNTAAATNIARFPEFSVNRLLLSAGKRQTRQGSPAYCLCFAETGSCRIDSAGGSLALNQGEAAFIPGSAAAVSFIASATARLLVATPES